MIVNQPRVLKMGGVGALLPPMPTLRRLPSDSMLKTRFSGRFSARPFTRRWGCLALFYVLIMLALFRRHLWCAYNLMSVYVYWGSAARGIGLSQWRDGLDVSFEAYDLHQTSAFPLNNGSVVMPQPLMDPHARQRSGHGRSVEPTHDLVPPIMHHILLGRPISSSPENWNRSRQACLDLHPVTEGWEYHFWDDEKAHTFLQQHYPWFLPTFDGYRYPIQRADSLRYFILYHFGGIFLDLDLECKRALGPLRRFPTVAISAQPAGVSNGFFMAAPRHPFLAQLIENIDAYDRNWVFAYPTVMLSTGPMFLSAEHLRFRPWWERRHDLRILSEPIHRLNGRVDTPLFRHLGSSSWHSDDAHAIKSLGRLVASYALRMGGKDV